MAEITYEESLQQLITVLRSHEVFTAFSDEEVAKLAARARFDSFEQGIKVINQDETNANEFFVVLSGQLRVIDVSDEQPELLNYLSPGDIFGTRALMADEPRAATVEVILDARLAIFNKDDWTWLIHQNDRIVDYFENLEREFEQPSLINFPGRQWDEVVVIAVKRHFLAFLARLTVPILLLIAPNLFLLVAELLGVELTRFLSDNPIWTIFIVIPFLVVAAAIALYVYLDWRNDDFIVTTKRVIHIERRLLFGEQRDEAPLPRIQDVTVQSYDIIERFFDYSNLMISTAGAGVMKFDGIPEASEMREMIFQERQRAIERVGAADLGSVRRMIATRLNWEDALERPVAEVAEKQGTIYKQTQTRRLPGLLNYLWPRVKEVHEDPKDGTVITWRKHYFILLKTTFLPFISFLISFYLFLAALIGFIPFDDPASFIITSVLGLLVLVSLGWYLLQYDDWSRDRYILTNRRIVDVEATPFRLQGEQRREGTFDNIQNITYNIPNFFSHLINIGNVVIETAGTERTFTFEQVFNPSGVQEEIFNRMVRYQQMQRERTRDATTGGVVEAIGEYHHLNEKRKHLPHRPQ